MKIDKKKHYVLAPPSTIEDNLPLNNGKQSKYEKKKKIEKIKKSKTKSVSESVKVKKPKSKSIVDDHKKSLEKLKKIDPEFYKFLEENDKKLLKFNADEDEEDDGSNENENQDNIEEGIKEDGDENTDEDEGEENDEDEGEEIDEEEDDNDEDVVHKPSETLELASDESDFEPDENEDVEETEENRKTRSITLKLLKKWQQELADDKTSIETIKNVILAVNSALLSISGEVNAGTIFKVEGAAVFNGIMQLCVLHLHPAIKRYLGLTGRTPKKPHKCKKWNKIRTSMKNYLIDLTKLLEHVSSANVLIVLLKHLHQISNFIGSFTVLTKPILKRLVILWSTSDETVRVIAFLCILKITRTQSTALLNTVLKAMYLSYVRNSKFVSPNTLPGINFMRRSLTEMFALDLNVSYQHVFLYIRQLAIHLRNAITLKKKDSLQAVYNWQYINSLRLWTEVLSATYNKPQLQPLLYPLVNIITGVIKLIPTAQFFPLRFHCIQMLNHISKETRTFIPVMPFILEVLNSNTFNQKHSKVSMKPLKFTCILRLNKSQLQENAFRDEVIENVFGLTLEYMAFESFTISYSDLVVPCILTLKQYLKKCRNRNYNSKIKQLCDKLKENSKMIDTEKEKVTFGLKDAQLIQAWELSLQAKGTPLLTFYNNWVKTDVRARKRHAVDSDNINEYDLPTIKRRTGEKKPMDDGPVELFPSDNEDEGMVELEKDEKKIKKKDKKSKKVAPKPVQENDSDEDKDDFIDNEIDIVKDLDLNDW